jgi:hypothetical protein
LKIITVTFFREFLLGNKNIYRRTKGAAEEVEHLLCKHEALSSNPSGVSINGVSWKKQNFQLE